MFIITLPITQAIAKILQKKKDTLSGTLANKKGRHLAYWVISLNYNLRPDTKVIKNICQALCKGETTGEIGNLFKWKLNFEYAKQKA